ncbi:MAG: hypothetical protein C0448_08130 [Sphingobacteriaceae bacterium]|nr:hypothetical protein [Sphingobacteriaceae bacterium]
MKKIFTCSLSVLFVLLISNLSYAQAFRKGSLIISISEGHTLANYRTNDISGGTKKMVANDVIIGVRDPLIIEYGVSNRWSIGLSSGNDIFSINPSKFYGFNTSDNKVKVSTSEFSFECSYHVFVNKKLDLSVFASTGLFSINMKGNDNDIFYNHTSNGTIVRYGTRAHYYFFKRLGAVGMISNYLANSSTKDVEGNNIAQNYSTSINGIAIEAGLCFRLLR